MWLTLAEFSKQTKSDISFELKKIYPIVQNMTSNISQNISLVIVMRNSGRHFIDVNI